MISDIGKTKMQERSSSLCLKALLLFMVFLTVISSLVGYGVIHVASYQFVNLYNNRGITGGSLMAIYSEMLVKFVSSGLIIVSPICGWYFMGRKPERIIIVSVLLAGLILLMYSILLFYFLVIILPLGVV